jgi:hypothetical protein
MIKGLSTGAIVTCRREPTVRIQRHVTLAKEETRSQKEQFHSLVQRGQAYMTGMVRKKNSHAFKVSKILFLHAYGKSEH